MSVEAVDEQGQSASVLKRPFISDSIRDNVSVYSPSSDAVLLSSIFFLSFYYNFYFAVIILLLSKNSCFTIIISSCFVLVIDHELYLDTEVLRYFYNINWDLHH